MKTKQGCWVIAGLVALAGCQAASTRREANRMPPAAMSKLALSAIRAKPALSDGRKPDSDIIQASATATSDKATSDTATADVVTANATTEFVTKVDVPAVPEQQSSAFALTLRDAVATGLVQNPDLVTMRGQEGVSVAALGVAETYPWNPFVQSQVLPGTGNGASGKTNYYVWVMQRFELAHQQQYREESASAALNQARWNIQQAELNNIALTTRVYFLALYQRELHDLALESAELNEKLLGVVERRFKANLAMAAEVTTAKVAARQTRRQAHLAEATYQAALLALRQQLNVPVSLPIQISDRLSDYAWHPVRSVETPDLSMTLPIESLATELVEGRPDVMAACAGVMVANANQQLAEAARVPDLQAGPIYNTFANGDATLGFRVQMDLPIWNNGAPLANQRHAERHQQSLIYSQLKTRAALEAQMAIDRYERARRLAEESQVELRPFAEQMPPDLREIMSQFEAGQADVLTVFVTQNNLLQERRTYLDLLNELAQSAAVVIQATALPPDHLITVRTQR